MIDTHSHIFSDQFDDDRPEAIKRAIEAGVEKIILPAIDSATHEKLIRTAAEFPEVCVPTMGLHPTSVNGNPGWREELALVEQYFNENPSMFRAVGEVGLDLYWSRDFIDRQVEVFKAQVELAIKAGLPLIIHTRDAWDEMLCTLEPYAGKVRGVFHSFSGTAETWQKIRDMDGFKIGVGGPVTYKKSPLRDILAEIPPEYILLETDSPYLTPVPHRGKRNESSYLPLVAATVAEIKGISLQEIDRITTDNARELFNL